MGKSKLIINKFHNETFEFDLEFIIYDYSVKEQRCKVFKRIAKSGVAKHDLKPMMERSQALFVGGSPYSISIDINEFNLKKESGIISLITVIAHECGHVRGEVLRDISEQMNGTITSTDTEFYQRISGWALKKCLGTKFIKSLLRSKKKKKQDAHSGV